MALRSAVIGYRHTLLNSLHLHVASQKRLWRLLRGQRQQPLGLLLAARLAASFSLPSSLPSWPSGGGATPGHLVASPCRQSIPVVRMGR